MKRKSDKTEMESRKKRLEKGAFYTPEWFIDAILERIKLPIGKDRLKICDPAMGDGALLKAAARKFGIEKVALDGTDLDSMAISKSIDYFKGKYAEETCQINFNCEDGLLNDKLSNGSYDLVLCNPPWKLLRLSGLADVGQRARASGNYPICFSDPQLSSHLSMFDLFLERTLSLVKPQTGVFVFITNASMLGNISSSMIVNYMQAHFYIPAYRIYSKRTIWKEVNKATLVIEGMSFKPMLVAPINFYWDDEHLGYVESFNDRIFCGSLSPTFVQQLLSKCQSTLGEYMNISAGVSYSSQSRKENKEKSDERGLACVQATCLFPFVNIDPRIVDSKHIDWVEMSKWSTQITQGEPYLATRYLSHETGSIRASASICLVDDAICAMTCIMFQFKDLSLSKELLYVFLCLMNSDLVDYLIRIGSFTLTISKTFWNDLPVPVNLTLKNPICQQLSQLGKMFVEDPSTLEANVRKMNSLVFELYDIPASQRKLIYVSLARFRPITIETTVKFHKNKP